MANKEETNRSERHEAGARKLSQMNDSIGLSRHKLRNSEVEELTLS